MDIAGLYAEFTDAHIVVAARSGLSIGARATIVYHTIAVIIYPIT